MKALKLVLLALTFASSIALPVMNAQEGPKAGKQGKGDRVKMMSEELGLSEAQIAQIKPIMADEAKALKALQDDTSLAQDAKRGKMREIRQAHSAKIRAVLTPEQQAKFDAMRPGGGKKKNG